MIFPPTTSDPRLPVEPANPWLENDQFQGISTPPTMGILHNPRSGRNKRTRNFVKPLMTRYSNIPYYEVVSPEDVADALEKLAIRGTQMVVINGGDGTVQAVLTTLLDRKVYAKIPLLAIVPSGTTNLIAEDVGIAGSPQQTLPKMLAWSFGGEAAPSIVHRHVLQVRVTPQHVPVFGMFLGMGAITDGIRACRQNEQKLGRMGRLGEGWILIRFLVGFMTRQRRYAQSVPLSISADGKEISHKACLAFFATTLERLFFGFRPFWGTEPYPLHCTTISEPLRYLWRILPSMSFGRPHDLGTPQNGYDSHNFTELQFRTHHDIVLDGEFHTPNPELGPVTIRSCGPVSFLKW